MTTSISSSRQSFTPAAKVPDSLKAGKFDKRHELWDAKLTNARVGSPGVGKIYGESAKFAFYVVGAEHPRMGTTRLVIAPMVCGEAQWSKSSTRALTPADIGALTTVIAESGAEFTQAVEGLKNQFELATSIGDAKTAKSTLRSLDFVVSDAADHNRADKLLVRINDPASYKKLPKYDPRISAALLSIAGGVAGSLSFPLGVSSLGVGVVALGAVGMHAHLFASQGVAKTNSNA